MPFVHLSTNVPKASVDVAAVHSALSKALSESISRNEQFIMTRVEFEVSLQLGKSNAPCALVHVRDIGHVDEQYNAKTAKELTDVVVSTLGVSGDRVAVIIEDVANTNWSIDGNLLTWVTD